VERPCRETAVGAPRPRQAPPAAPALRAAAAAAAGADAAALPIGDGRLQIGGMMIGDCGSTECRLAIGADPPQSAIATPSIDNLPSAIVDRHSAIAHRQLNG